MNTVAAAWVDPSADAVVVVVTAAGKEEEAVVEESVEVETGTDAPEAGTDGSPINVVLVVAGWDTVGCLTMAS